MPKKDPHKMTNYKNSMAFNVIKRKYKFKDLMSKVTEENANKFNWGKPLGKEIW